MEIDIPKIAKRKHSDVDVFKKYINQEKYVIVQKSLKKQKNKLYLDIV